MFWSGNYIVVRELNFLLKEENVTLSQVLEADDILQECKADNKGLVQFLTKPENLAELITLITEEPPRNVELGQQYRLANIACEVLTSQLSLLSDRLSLDTVQMNRLCDFINKDPPLNPLLASYFSKTVEMLLERSPKQDWYLYHIVCLRVLDFFKSRRDFLPNLLRHISTSAIADTLKYFIRLDDLFKKTVMEWFEEHQFLECLIQIICGTYVPEEFHPAVETNRKPPEQPEKGEQEQSEKAEVNHKEDQEGQGGTAGEGDKGAEASEAAEPGPCDGGREEAGEREEAVRRRREEAAAREEAVRRRREEAAARTAAVAAANGAALLCDLLVNGDGCPSRARAGWSLAARLQAEGSVRALLQGMFTSPRRARRHALVHGCHVLLAMLALDPLRMKKADEEENAVAGAGAGEEERSAVELAVAPHLPLLHQSLLHNPADHEAGGGAVGLARVQVAALLAQLALSSVEEVATTMLTLGTPGVLVDMFFRHENNNFLHAQLHALVHHALDNRAYRTHYARHLLVECDLLTRLMDAYEANKNKKAGEPRAGYMGHVVAILARLARALEPADELAQRLALPPALLHAWAAFLDAELRPALQLHDTPLGGSYPSENIYEVENMADTLAGNCDFNDMAATATMDEFNDDVNADDANEMCGNIGDCTESADFIADGLGIDNEDKMTAAKNNFLELANQRFDDDMWEDSPAADAELCLPDSSPWDCGGSDEGEGEDEGRGAGWAHFDAFAAPPADPFAPAAPASPASAASSQHQEFSPFWAYSDTHSPEESRGQRSLEAGMRELRLEGGAGGVGGVAGVGDEGAMDEAASVELANNLLTAMSGMSPAAIANIVNANLPPAPTAPTPTTPTPTPTPTAPADR